MWWWTRNKGIYSFIYKWTFRWFKISKARVYKTNYFRISVITWSKYTSELNGSEFVNKTVTKKLADITSNEEYEEVTEETKSKTIEDPITLNLDETYFESVIITEKSFIGKVNSEKVEEVIGIKNAGSVEIRIELTDDLKVNTIEIKYTDLGSGYLVTMKSKYTF